MKEKENNNYKIFINGELFIDDSPEVVLKGYGFDHLIVEKKQSNDDQNAFSTFKKKDETSQK